MSEARVLPVLGALLGALIGLVTMALLTVLGVLAPDRLPLFALIGVGIIVGAAMLTQRIDLAKKRLVAAIVVGALFAGVSLTGIPEVTRGGAVSQGCMATGTSSLEPNPLGPANTSAVHGFSMTTTDTVQWTTQTSAPLAAATGTVSLVLGGFSIPIRHIQFEEVPEIMTWSGASSVAHELAAIQDASGFLVTGVYQVAVNVDTDAGECAGNAYLHVAPAGPFDTTLLVLLWVVLAALVIGLLVLTVVVRRSIRESDRSLAMVGMSAIAGETSTDVPESVPSPTGTSGLREPTQPTAPDPYTNDEPVGEGEPVSDHNPVAHDSSHGDSARAHDDRIGEGDVAQAPPHEGEADRPPSA